MATAKDVLKVAKGWIGYSEDNGKFKEILDLYNSYRPRARGYAIKLTDEWCDAFASAVAIKANAVALIGTEVGCEKHITIFKKKGIWIEDGTITPRPGDIIMYSWGVKKQPNDKPADHIGYVETVKDGIITIIEGNKGEVVGRRTKRIGDSEIRGYARPKYDTEKPAPTPIAPKLKSIDEIAREVLDGKWGNGAPRKKALKEAGYDYKLVQDRVNEIMTGKIKTPVKSINTLAQEVINGKWGNGAARKKALIAAGYDYDAVQARVNKLL